MAIIRLDHTAQTTKVILPLNIILPDPGKMNGIPVRKRKVLYLLHGLSDDASAWQRFSSVEILARDYGLIVVMPSVGRSFYTDMPNGQKFFSYIMEELPQYLSDVFDLAPSREDTLIAGLSMGGYGALKAALLYPERFCAAGSFSGAISLALLAARTDDPRYPEFTSVFGDLSRLEGSVHDPMVWLKNAAANPGLLPKLYVSCGKQDDLLMLNRLFQKQCESLGIPLEYHEEEGTHDWPFWDRQIAEFLKFALG